MADFISDFSRFKFLVVDDFAGMRTLLRDMLRECGARDIDEASNGKDASSLVSRRKYDMVLCDYNLGAGKNGQQILEEAKVNGWIGPLCAWVMITAEKTPDTVVGAMEYQPDGYLIKPVNSALLYSRLGKLLARKSAFAEIDARLKRRDYQGALALCDEKMTLDKGAYATDLLRWKTQLLLSIGEHAQARELFERILAERDVPWAQVGLAKAMQLSGEYAESRSLLEQVVAENPANVEAYDWLAQAQDKLGDLDGARKTLERAAQLSPNSPVRQKNLGDAALRQGDVAAAEAAFRKSMHVGEHSVLKTPDSYIGLAHILGDKKQLEEATRLLRKMPQAFNTDAAKIRAKAVEGLIARKNGNETRAAEAGAALAELVKNAQTGIDVAASMEAATLLLATGRQEDAVGLLAVVVQNNHDNAELMEQISDAFTDAGLASVGVQWMEQARRETVALMNQGVLLARDGKLDEAVAAMRHAVETMPNNVRVLLNCGHVMLLALQQQFDPALKREARQILLSANALSPGEKRFSQLISQLETLKPGA
ncbi:tetratricopeptide repeat protein [Paludibacterium yongneupense]|uniref:tetratricopeptide repeat protein n=1 Tax=Paludibacterium yongneupense TaxID=400061 RepID=UPI000415AA9E|nr:tetratricopeptide repeat protein [Paludibacterium yongneupense]